MTMLQQTGMLAEMCRHRRCHSALSEVVRQTSRILCLHQTPTMGDTVGVQISRFGTHKMAGWIQVEHSRDFPHHVGHLLGTLIMWNPYYYLSLAFAKAALCCHVVTCLCTGDQLSQPDIVLKVLHTDYQGEQQESRIGVHLFMVEGRTLFFESALAFKAQQHAGEQGLPELMVDSRPEVVEGVLSWLYTGDSQTRLM